jgi:hypothetical protein
MAGRDRRRSVRGMGSSPVTAPPAAEADAGPTIRLEGVARRYTVGERVVE